MCAAEDRSGDGCWFTPVPGILGKFRQISRQPLWNISRRASECFADPLISVKLISLLLNAFWQLENCPRLKIEVRPTALGLC